MENLVCAEADYGRTLRQCSADHPAEKGHGIPYIRCVRFFLILLLFIYMALIGCVYIVLQRSRLSFIQLQGLFTLSIQIPGLALPPRNMGKN
jgi:hypothetical protein